MISFNDPLTNTFGSREESFGGWTSISTLSFVKRQTVISCSRHHLHVLLGLWAGQKRLRAVDAPGVGVGHIQPTRHRIRGQVVAVSGIVTWGETYKQ